MLVLSRKRDESIFVDLSKLIDLACEIASVDMPSPGLMRERLLKLLGGETTIQIKAVEIRGDKVRIGIEAPRELAVHRDEVWKAIHDQTSDVTLTERADELRAAAAL